MAKRPCLDCGALTARGPRCPTHARPVERARTQAKRVRRPHLAAEDRRRADVVAAWRAVHGDWCPGWKREPHESSDLTADHIESFAVTGREDGPLAVLCRPCNSRKQSSQ